MKDQKYILGLAVAVLVCLSTAARAQAPKPQTATFTLYDLTISSAFETDSYGINNSNMVTGDYIESDGTTWHGMTCKLGKKGACGSVTNLDDPNGTKTQGYGINTKGVVVGYYLNSSGLDQGFMYSAGTFTDVGPTGDVSIANAINDKGLIVGAYNDPNTGIQHGFLFDGKNYTELEPSACSSGTQAWGINNKNVISLYCVNSSGTYDGYITKNNGKTYTKLDDSSETSTILHKINSSGSIDGTGVNSSGTEDGLLYYKSTWYSFDDSKGTNTRADGLNDKIVIVGRYGAGPSGGNGGFGFVAYVKFK